MSGCRAESVAFSVGVLGAAGHLHGRNAAFPTATNAHPLAVARKCGAHVHGKAGRFDTIHSLTQSEALKPSGKKCPASEATLHFLLGDTEGSGQWRVDRVRSDQEFVFAGK